MPVFKELEFMPAMIGLAVGKKAVAYGPAMGTISGEDVMHSYFRDDLGFTSMFYLPHRVMHDSSLTTLPNSLLEPHGPRQDRRRRGRCGRGGQGVKPD